MISEVTNECNMQMMARYPDNFFDLAIVDPPYGIGDKKLTQGGSWASKYKSGDAKWDLMPTPHYFDELMRVSRNQIIWGGNYFDLPPTRCFLIWDKKTHLPTMADCEFAWTSFDKNAKIVKQLRSGNQTKETRIHITQKPINLYRWILQNYSIKGDKILDTNLGSQSSRIAAHIEGFDFYGCELDPDYFKEGCKRFDNHILQQRLF